MLRVACCYVTGSLHVSTITALDRWARNAETILDYVGLDARDPLAYGVAIRELWLYAIDQGEDLCLIEQDIEVGPSTLFDFRACQHPYCGAPYPWTSDVGVAMGCTRFRHSFLQEHVVALDEALATAPHFRQLDVVFQRRVLAEKYGQQPHVHAPVVHHNPEKALRPGASPVPIEGVPVGDIGNLL